MTVSGRLSPDAESFALDRSRGIVDKKCNQRQGISEKAVRAAFFLAEHVSFLHSDHAPKVTHVIATGFTN